MYIIINSRTGLRTPALCIAKMCTRVYVIIGLVSYLPKVGGSVASFIDGLALACSITYRNCILSPDSLTVHRCIFFYSNALKKNPMVSGIYFIFQ
jgi:hypothetical protein